MTRKKSALASSQGIGLLHINVCASILLITSCFDHVQPTVLIPAYPRNRFTDAVKFSFEGTGLLMKGNYIKKSILVDEWLIVASENGLIPSKVSIIINYV